jgi:2'-5' RNA ligase
MMTMMTIGYVLLLLHHKGSQQHWCHQDSRKKKHPHVTVAQTEMSDHACAHELEWQQQQIPKGVFVSRAISLSLRGNKSY